MRTPAEIMADSQASAAEIQSLMNDFPKLVVTHANCPIDLWFELAREWPLEAMQSPVFPLVLLSEPDRWIDLASNRGGTWLEEEFLEIPFKSRQLLAADCVDRLAAKVAEDPSIFPPTTIKFAAKERRRTALGTLTWEAWRGVRDHIGQLHHSLLPIHRDLSETVDDLDLADLRSFSEAVVAACCYENLYDVIGYVRRAIVLWDAFLTGKALERVVVRRREKLWAWERFMYYYQQEHP